jgi:hypothetical protein
MTEVKLANLRFFMLTLHCYEFWSQLVIYLQSWSTDSFYLVQISDSLIDCVIVPISDNFSNLPVRYPIPIAEMSDSPVV